MMKISHIEEGKPVENFSWPYGMEIMGKRGKVNWKWKWKNREKSASLGCEKGEVRVVDYRPPVHRHGGVEVQRTPHLKRDKTFTNLQNFQG